MAFQDFEKRSSLRDAMNDCLAVAQPPPLAAASTFTLAASTLRPPALAPHRNMAAMPESPHGGARPPAMKRHSSQSSHGGSRQVASPSSVGQEPHPLRHAVGGRGRHAKVVLPRNHNSGRNLAKMGKQAAAGQHVQYADDGKRHARQRSHEGDSEIRLPGSLDESRPSIKRNMTSQELPRNKSGTKLKKNLSHGQLTRLSSGKNLVNMALTHKAPPSPGLKGKKGRARSEEISREKDLHEQEVDLQRMQQERKASQEAGAPRKVGFAVGSAGDNSDDGEMPQMEGSGMQDDEWTDNSASASPMSTRLNTASNSRRPSVAVDKPPDEEEGEPQHPNIKFHMTELKAPKRLEEQMKDSTSEAERTPPHSEEEDVDDGDEDDTPSPKSMPVDPISEHMDSTPEPAALQPHAEKSPVPTRSPLHAAKEHVNPAAKRLTSAQAPAPALLSNISALDDLHSARASPAPSLRSTRSISVNDGAADTEQVHELVSKFLPSTSHPSTGSGANTGAMNTPKMGSFQGSTLEDESTLHRAAKATGVTFSAGPVSPGSTRSASSGATTPALGQSRIERSMARDKALADHEALNERRPFLPAHIFDRRNETLKSYLNLIALGADGQPTIGLPLSPAIFQGRFKAVNIELKVVQKFRDPIAESVRRMKKCPGTKLAQRASPLKMKTSKSAVALPSRVKPVPEPSKLATSVSPPKAGPPVGAQAKSHSPQKTVSGLQGAKSAVQIQPRRGVSFAGMEPIVREQKSAEEELTGPDAIAKMLWDNVIG
ncbi:hypothetical protein LTR53_010010 [Teratosphaeriaceae sp. CCFEE 6253]|nr:hypothetical protein LTR53_010010 [Teratosphaeriaceae sp. CCFEE 6253]